MYKKLLKSFFLFFSLVSCAFADGREEEFIEHVKRCIVLAEKQESPLNHQVLSIEGMAGQKTRHFLNNLCSLPNTSYLEIGCWKGSTLIAALYKNESHVDYAVGIDNWSQFNGPRNAFFKNVQKFLPAGLLHFFESDSFSIDTQMAFPVPVNIYFYDGHHSWSAQKEAFTYFNDIFDDVFIAVVDDWNWEQVQEGTRSGFASLNYKILFEQEFFTSRNGDAPGWWNGLYIAVIKKPATPY